MQRILRDPTQRDPRPTTPPLRGASDPAERSHTTPTRQIAGPARCRHRCRALLAIGALLCSTLVVTATGGPVAAAQGDISLVGGVGSRGYTGDCIPATQVSLPPPEAIAVGPDGTTAIVMPSRNMVLRVDEGVARIMWGNGGVTFTPDGAVAALNPLNNPAGIAVESNGDLLVAERGTHRIRRIDADTGVLTTVAGNGLVGATGDGGPATAARLSFPTALSVDADDNLYIVDNSTRIRRVDATTGVITTVVSGFANVRGVAVSSDSSRVYFSQNQTIQAYTTSTDTVKVLAGSFGGYGGDGGPAQSALLDTPRGLAVDAAGHLFIADTGNHRIRRIDTATEIITTVAGNGTAGFTQGSGPPTDYQLNLPFDVALTAAGDLRIADWANLRVRGIVGGRLLNLAGDGDVQVDENYCLEAHLARFWDPIDALDDGAGGIYVADSTINHRIRRIDTATGYVTTIAGTGFNGTTGDGGPATAAGVANPQALDWDLQGRLLVATGTRVRRIDLTTGIITTIAGTESAVHSGDGGPATSAGLGTVVAIDHDPQGRLVIATPNRVRRVALDGTISTIAGTGATTHSGDGGPATGAGLGDLSGLTVDPAGNVWTSHGLANRIRRIDAATGVITTAAGDSVPGFAGDGGPATAARLADPQGLAADTAGNIYVADRNNNRVRRIDATTGHIATVAGNGTTGFNGNGGPATAAAVDAPRGVSIAPDGDLLITTTGADQHRVRRVEGQSPTGYLRVTTTPAVPAAITVNGIPRDAWGLTWLELPTGTHQVCFGAVDGFTPPPCQEVLIAPDQTTTYDGAYTARGYLRVTTTPAVPATITVDGVPRNDWGLWTEVDPGTYDVCFGGVADFEQPPCQQAVVVAGDTTHIDGTYTDLPGKEGPQGHGYLRATTSPATGSRITIDGNWTDSWGLTWLKLELGVYEVCFDDVLYRTSPDCQDVKIEAGQTEVVDGAFTPHGFLQVSTSPAVPATIYVDGHRANTWGVYTSLEPGPHTVCFSALPDGGLLPPPCQQVDIDAGATTQVTGTYQ